ncbi:uncharacterized protein LOC143040219 isoform X2 [Oratosquilla oratoria]|uniref:uncharacterized protein LOC143040219 isoform X1 n=1 Tax=Oratosquilla oratoria TaxID=337810 RepID=UPI003F771621
MDASNEFKVFLSPSTVQKAASGNKLERRGVKQRLVPVINKVLAPSSFMAQRKTSVYKAVSGVSFQDIDVGGKKSKKRDKKDRTIFDRKEEVGLPPSESERSLMSGKSEKSLRSSQNSKSAIAAMSKGDFGGLASPKKHRSSDRRRKSEKLHSPSFNPENNEKIRVSTKGERLRVRSASRTRSFSATENPNLSLQSPAVADAVPDETPVRPKRARSASRPRKSAIVPPPFLAAKQCNNKNNRGSSSEGTGQYSLKNKCGTNDQEESHIKDYSDQGKQNDCEVADDDAYGRSRSRRKWENVCGIETREATIHSKGPLDKPKDGDDDDPEGGYFSLEKEEKLGSFGNITFVYEALPTSSGDEQFENDHSLEAIYVCQVFKKEDSDVDDDHAYENYQIIRMTKDGDIISENDEKYENFQIVRRMNDEELQAMDIRKETPQENDDDAYENLEYTSPGKTPIQENTKAFFCRHRPKTRTSDSIPYIDASEGSGDEVETRSSVVKGVSPSTEVTVITIKDNDNVEISQKHGSLHPKHQQLRLADRVRHSLIWDEKYKDFFAEERKKTMGDDGIVLDATDRSPNVIVPPKRSSLSLGGYFSRPEAFSPSRLGVITTPSQFSSSSEISIMPKTSSNIESKKLMSASVEQNIISPEDSTISYSHFTEAGNLESRTHISSKPTPQELSESFSDEDIHINGEFESFSETDYELDNIDYDMFQPKLKDHKPKAESPPPVVAPPRRKRSAKNREERRPSRRQSSPEDQRPKDEVTDDLPSPKTFLALLENRYLNPPESDSESVLIEVEEKTEALQTSGPHDSIVPGSRDVVQSYRVDRGLEESFFTTREELFQGEVEEAHLVTWSDAESEFEFVNCNKTGPPQTCVAYKEISTVDECSNKHRALSSKPSLPVKRSQSMKASYMWRT